MNKIILDLCGGTGSWSKPYKDAGYDVRLVTLPMHDVLTYQPPVNVYGILAAPPCTMFSIARQDSTATQPRDLRKGMKTVRACLEIIWECAAQGALQFWALENPGSFLIKFLGHPPFVFQPTYFGDTHTKKTALWGKFNIPERRPVRMKFGDGFDNYDKLHEIPEGYVLPPDMDRRQVRRSITPPHFAKAFMEANR